MLGAPLAPPPPPFLPLLFQLSTWAELAAHHAPQGLQKEQFSKAASYQPLINAKQRQRLTKRM